MKTVRILVIGTFAVICIVLALKAQHWVQIDSRLDHEVNGIMRITRAKEPLTTTDQHRTHNFFGERALGYPPA